MKEDYVSFETAKQLKEKGFDLECKSFYYDNGKFDTRQVVLNFNKSESCFTAPTLYIAQKWLRVQHNIHIEICMAEQRDYYIGLVIIDKNNNYKLTTCKDYYNTYEEALDAGIIEALRLI